MLTESGTCSIRSSRRGMTMVEILVVIGVLLLLLSLLLPALQRARALARRIHCASNLRKLALAVHSYHDSFGVVPPVVLSWFRELGIGLSDDVQMREFSPQCMLLPWLGHSELFNAINFSIDGLDAQNLSETYVVLANKTVMETRVSVFVCPSDPEARTGPCLSYRGCMGILDYLPRRRGWPDSGRGVFRQPSIRFNEIVDGLANTAMFSERLVGRGLRYKPASDPLRRGIIAVDAFERTASAWRRVCVAASSFVPGAFRLDHMPGRYWLLSTGRFALYNHRLPPNSSVWDCANAWLGAYSARSGHAGGVVNVAFADGHVRPIADTVAAEVWEALGTRDGGEPISARGEF